MTIIWTAPAKEYLNQIFKYFKDNVSAERAHIIINSILDAPEIFFNKNVITEEIGQIEFDLVYRNRDYRYLIESYYKVIYFIDGQNIVITHAFDTRQDPNKKTQ